MNADTFFCIGKTHIICQDYAEAGGDNVIVSDGCSSADDTHIGSILVTRAAKLCLDEESPEVFYNKVNVAAKFYAGSLALKEEALLATLGIVKCDGMQFHAMMYGDGVFAARRKHTHTWDITVIEFPSGAPYYLSYKLNKLTDNEYFKKFGSQSKITQYELLSDGSSTVSLVQNHPTVGPFVWGYPCEVYDTVAVLSDGATSFQKTVVTQTSKRLESVPVCNILNEVLGFKNYNGQFVQRRCKAAFRKFSDEGCANMDDFSLGVVFHE